MDDKYHSDIFRNAMAHYKLGVSLKENDIILKVNNKDCTSLDDNQIVSLIKENSDNVDLIIKRDNQELNFTVKLDSLNVPAISYDILDNNIGYLYISTFSNTLSEQVKNAINELELKGIKSLIIDVRDNSGGYLVAASDVASLFLEKGKAIYSLKSNELQQIYYDETDEKRDYNIAVLINKNSASAAEILAAALKESYGAILIGNTSFGKGRVQQTKKLSNGKMVKYTTAKWMTPNNNCIDSVGLKPDYEVDLIFNYNESGEAISYNDTQLKKAIEILGKK